MASINDLATAAIASSTAARSGVQAGDAPRPATADTGSGPSESKIAAAAGSTDAGSEVVRGALVVLEGLDRSGKTTQVKLLEQRFVELGRKVKVLRFPDRSTSIGQMIDGYLKSQVEMNDHVIHLLFSANRWEAVKTITAHLTAGTTILCDRYYHSGIVYSAAKQNPSLSLSWARAPEIGLPRPDLVLFLDLEEGAARARGGWGGEVYEKGEMQRRVRELFWGLSLGRTGGDAAAAPVAVRADGVVRTAEESGVVPVRAATEGRPETQFRQEEEDLQVVDASPSVEDVAEEIWKIVRLRVEAVERGEFGKVVRTVS